jgi:DNA-binding response OmpR family regulator
MKILYVENNRHFYEAVKKEFQSEHELHNEVSVTGAKASYESSSFDLVLVDYDLDDGKGDKVVIYIRARDQEIPILAVSSHEMGNRKMLSAGATSSCEKMKFRSISEQINNVTVDRR